MTISVLLFTFLYKPCFKIPKKGNVMKGQIELKKVLEGRNVEIKKPPILIQGLCNSNAYLKALWHQYFILASCAVFDNDSCMIGYIFKRA